MACMKLGSKADVFHLDGHTWLCSTGLSSDVCIEVGETSFHLHKFPLLSRSRLLEKLIREFSGNEKCVLQLQTIPGGAKTFLRIAKFCYDVKLELTATNVVSLRCASEYLEMNEDYGEGNLIKQAESFLNEVFGSWVGTFKALETCEDALPLAEELHIVSRCIDCLATKACAEPVLMSPVSTVLWNGIHSTSKPHTPTEDWWYEDVAFLKLPLFKRFMLAVATKGMKPERISEVVMFYTKRHIPLNGRQSSFQNGNNRTHGSTLHVTSDADQRTLLEEIVRLLPNQKGVTPTKFLLRLLRTSMILQASPSCRENLERKIGAQFDQAVLEDLLITNMGYSMETLYDTDCVQRIIDHFVLMDQDQNDSTLNPLVHEGQLVRDSHSFTPMTMVANLVDSYLAEVAPDVNLKLPKFLSLAAVIPEYARALDDGIYRAIDIYLKAHPWLTDSEREQLCRIMNCQKLSLEASTHAAQNERLPLRVIVQVLFFEQLRLRTSVAGWLFVSDNLENSQNHSGNLVPRNDCMIPISSGGDQNVTVNDMSGRVSELEKECLNMKQEIEKLVKTKGSWDNFYNRFALKLKVKPFDLKSVKMPCNGLEVKTPRKAVSNGKQIPDTCKLDDRIPDL
ncbi:BTB/POZ domain-containing protein [Abeliophyllum distichum]|uniref:BTB/POZ domain-containing protein n=1 Tax=Abeliophyllum distichum TaxID=126358 RepID=A0ABD1VT57_9LAMI